MNPVLQQISNLVQWLTKKSSDGGKYQLDENEATFMAFHWRNECVSKCFLLLMPLFYSQVTENVNTGQECKKWEGKDGVIEQGCVLRGEGRGQT